MIVTALKNKVVTSISCGSLHCVVCTDEGEVYCWGDNDEGQLGDGTIIARQTPVLNLVLQVILPSGSSSFKTFNFNEFFLCVSRKTVLS